MFKILIVFLFSCYATVVIGQYACQCIVLLLFVMMEGNLGSCSQGWRSSWFLSGMGEQGDKVLRHVARKGPKGGCLRGICA